MRYRLQWHIQCEQSSESFNGVENLATYGIAVFLFFFLFLLLVNCSVVSGAGAGEVHVKSCR
jgi:hypothetical protein